MAIPLRLRGMTRPVRATMPSAADDLGAAGSPRFIRAVAASLIVAASHRLSTLSTNDGGVTVVNI